MPLLHRHLSAQGRPGLRLVGRKADHRALSSRVTTGGRHGLRVVAQTAGLWAIGEAGFALTSHFDLPLPGNLVGMVMLLLLLATGAVKLDWVSAAATFLLRHLAFFFIPIAVGLMTMGPLMRSHGLALLAVLAASAAAGILVAGGVTQRLSRRRDARSATSYALPSTTDEVAP